MVGWAATSPVASSALLSCMPLPTVYLLWRNKWCSLCSGILYSPLLPPHASMAPVLPLLYVSHNLSRERTSRLTIAQRVSTAMRLLLPPLTPPAISHSRLPPIYHQHLLTAYSPPPLATSSLYHACYIQRLRNTATTTSSCTTVYLTHIPAIYCTTASLIS